MRIAISAGHGQHVRGASSYLDEVDEARRVVEGLAYCLLSMEIEVAWFFESAAHSQSENLANIVNWHNAQARELDVSVHFNAYQMTDKPMGTEVLYLTQEKLAGIVAAEIAEASGLPDRGAKHRTDLYFLNKTRAPAILIEVCFVDSSADAEAYERKFEMICQAIAEGLASFELA